MVGCFKEFCCLYHGGVVLMEHFYLSVGINVGQGFPAVMCFRKPFPLDQILELIALSSYVQSLFDFPLWLSIDKVWGWFCEIHSVFPCLLVQGE